jgi:hypothetical protein
MRWPYANGKAPSAVLVEVEPGNHLRADAAAAWVLFRAACFAATGVWLTATSANRTYARQVELFLERYSTRNSGRKSRVWNGTRYWLKAGQADAATPGTSNHGWAIAVDMGGYSRAWSWIVANCGRFGFSLSEGLSVGEKWHIVFVRAWDGRLSGGGRLEEGQLSTPGTPIGGPDIPVEDTLSAAEVTEIKNHIDESEKRLLAKIEEESRGRVYVVTDGDIRGRVYIVHLSTGVYMHIGSTSQLESIAVSGYKYAAPGSLTAPTPVTAVVLRNILKDCDSARKSLGGR